MTSMTSTRELAGAAAAATGLVPPCPRCHGPRVNQRLPKMPPLYWCEACKQQQDTALPPAADDAPPPPPDDHEDIAEWLPSLADQEPPPPPPDDEPPPADPPVEASLPADASAALVPAGRTEVLPAGFELPLDVKFVPNVQLRAAADADAELLMTMPVTTRQEMERMDNRLEIQREHKKVILAHFEEPKAVANERHKRLTAAENQFLEKTKRAIEIGGRRVAECHQKLERQAEEQRRVEQEKADQAVRAAAARELEAAKAAAAPPEVVEELEREVQEAIAPPVPVQESSRSAMRSSTIVETHKGRLKGTLGEALQQQPSVADLTPAQRLSLFEALRAVLDGKAPIAVIDINWTYINQRARADKKTFTIPGFEVYVDAGTRGKATRSR